MVTRSRVIWSRRTALLAAAMMLISSTPTLGAHSSVTEVRGRAFGYHADEIMLFGGSQADTGPTPIVTLASDAGNSPRSATTATGSVQYGPAVLFSSGQIGVKTAGNLGPGGSVTSSSQLEDVNESGDGLVTAERIRSSCTATSTGTGGSTTITDGVLETDNGSETHSPVLVNLPTDPAPNTQYEGHIHQGGSQEAFRVVLNEQVVNGDGSRTIDAVHIQYLGPVLTGHLILGRVVCGVTVGAGQHQADGRIRKGAGRLVGNDIYTTDGTSQTRSGKRAPGKTITFGISIQNDGDGGDRFRVHASGVTVDGYRVRYFRGRKEITGGVVAGSYRTPKLAPGDDLLIRAKVKVKPSAGSGSSVTRLVSSTSVGDITKVDAVRFIVRRA